MIRAEKYSIEDSSQAGEIRRSLSHWTKDLDLNEKQSGSISIVVNELASNILKHATRGEIICTLDERSLSILAIDKGPGIADLDEAFRDGYSSQGTAGNGLGAVKRLSTEFDIYTQPGKGTIILSRFEKRPASEDEKFESFGFSLPVKGEIVSGDGWVHVKDSVHKLMVCDGLGHGLQAHEANLKAIEVFQKSFHPNPLNDVNYIHEGLKSTRGGAIAVAYVDLSKRIVEYCGLGNIVGNIVGRTTIKRLISYNGTAGVQMRKVQSLPYPIEKDAFLILNSDGLSSNWNLQDYPGLFIRHPLIVAALLYRDFNRGNDDVTVIVGREK